MPTRRRLRLTLLVLLLSAAGLHADPPATAWKSDPHFVVNHRSGRVFAPQETVPAILYSVGVGADAVDVDLRRTLDGVIVCFHDRWVMTRDCFGPVEVLSWEVLSRADVGFEFDPEFAGARILTFDEVVRFCAANDVSVHLESKVGDVLGDVLKIVDRHGAIALVVDMQGLPKPGRKDYRRVALRLHTMGQGGDDDRWIMRRRVETSSGRRLTINVEDAFCIADVLDRRPERRAPGTFKLDAPPPTPKDGRTADALLETLGGDDASKTIDAIVRLVGRREKRVLDLLRRYAATHPSTDVRAVALWALGPLDDADSFDLLAKTARSTPADEWIIPYAAMWALSEMDTPEAVKVLAGIARRGLDGQTEKELNPNGWYAWDALHVLGRMKTPGAVDVLGASLRAKPGNRYLTEVTAASLARLGGPKAIEHLVACLDEERPTHRREIVWALVRLAPESVPAVVKTLAPDRGAPERVNALRVLGRCAKGFDEPPQTLFDCLESPAAEIRGEAAWVCGRRGFGGAAGAINVLVRDKDENVRLDAAQALKRLGRTP